MHVLHGVWCFLCFFTFWVLYLALGQTLKYMKSSIKIDGLKRLCLAQIRASSCVRNICKN